MENINQLDILNQKLSNILKSTISTAVLSNIGIFIFSLLSFFVWNTFISLIIFYCVLIATYIYMGVEILRTDWIDKDLNKDKKIWGILTIIPLGWIASLVFYINANKKIKKMQNELDSKTTNESSTNESSNNLDSKPSNDTSTNESSNNIN